MTKKQSSGAPSEMVAAGRAVLEERQARPGEYEAVELMVLWGAPNVRAARGIANVFVKQGLMDSRQVGRNGHRKLFYRWLGK